MDGIFFCCVCVCMYVCMYVCCMYGLFQKRCEVASLTFRTFHQKKLVVFHLASVLKFRKAPKMCNIHSSTKKSSHPHTHMAHFRKGVDQGNRQSDTLLTSTWTLHGWQFAKATSHELFHGKLLVVRLQESILKLASRTMWDFKKN